MKKSNYLKQEIIWGCNYHPFSTCWEIILPLWLSFFIPRQYAIEKLKCLKRPHFCVRSHFKLKNSKRGVKFLLEEFIFLSFCTLGIDTLQVFREFHDRTLASHGRWNWQKKKKNEKGRRFQLQCKGYTWRGCCYSIFIVFGFILRQTQQ